MQNTDNWFSFEFKNKTYFVSIDGEIPECRRVHDFGNTVYISKREVTDEKIISLAEKLCKRMKKNNSPCGAHFCLKEYIQDGRLKCSVAEYEGHCDLHKEGVLSNTFANTVLKWYSGLLLCTVIALLSIVLMERATAFSTINIMGKDLAYKVVSFVLTLTCALYMMLEKKTWQMMLIVSFVPMSIVTVIASAVQNKQAKLVSIIIVAAFVLITSASIVGKQLGAKKRIINGMTSFLLCMFLCAASCELVLMSEEFTADEAAVKDISVIENSYESALGSVSDKTWTNLSIGERIGVLQAICDYECEVNLGFDTLTVGIQPLPDYTNAVFLQRDKMIMLNNTYIETADSERVVTTLLHEIRHAYQYELVKMYYRLKDRLTPSAERLQPFRLAREFAENAEHYVDVSESIDGYYYQSVERDSREWADLRIIFYMPYIEYEEPASA